MSEGRDIYHEPKQKVLLRTADVYPVSYTHLDVYKRQLWTNWWPL